MTCMSVNDIDDLVTMMVATTMERYKLIPDRKKIRKIVDMTLSSKSHMTFVSKAEGNINGYLVVGSFPSDIGKKYIGNILYFDFGNLDVARTLITQAMDWVKSRRAIQLVYFSVPFTTEATGILLENSFKQSESMIYWRREWEFSQKSGKA